MAEVLVVFDTTLRTRDGRRFLPQACGRMLDSRLWEGWLEFLPADGGAPVRSGRETEQPNRADLKYWAEGLSQVYLEGALNRALARPVILDSSVAAEPAFNGPRPGGVAADPPVTPAPRPVLDPFSVHAQGPDVLRRQLSALDADHLRGIILAYGFTTAAEANAAGREELIGIIVGAAGSAGGGA